MGPGRHPVGRSIRSLERGIQRCRRCERWRTRQKAVAGEGPARAGIILIGEAPGKWEDQSGRPFAGRAGRYLDRMLDRRGIERESVYITSVLKCFHPGPPRKEQIAACLPWTLQQLEALQPRGILVMGRTAEAALMEAGSLEGGGGEGPCVAVTSHPAAAMRFPLQDRKFRGDLQRFVRRMDG
ncbi:MAG: uracil-DNA glycosylase [Candidatus Eisenbacteria bacterium]|nr:uracil-DNA glycosylase [Candidatus Eisenbacteria bacterium]